MGKALADFAMQAGQGIVGGLTGLAFGAINDRRQLRQQEKLQNLEIRGNKQLSDYNYAKQLQMWKDTNYSAQMEQIKKAGLNPALIYGMAGSGGMTGGGGQSVTGGSAPSGGGEGIYMADKAMQIGLMRAQKENIEADTAKKQAETTKTSGVDTTEAQTRINDLMQGIENKKAQEAMTRVETALTSMEISEKQMSQEDRMDYIHYQTQQAMYALGEAERQAFISRATLHAKVDIIRAEAIGAILRNELTQAQTGLAGAQTGKTLSDIQVNKAQIEKWSQELFMGWESLDQNEQRIKIEQFTKEIEANYPSVSKVAGRIFDDAIQRILNITDKGERAKLKRIK